MSSCPVQHLKHTQKRGSFNLRENPAHIFIPQNWAYPKISKYDSIKNDSNNLDGWFSIYISNRLDWHTSAGIKSSALVEFLQGPHENPDFKIVQPVVIGNIPWPLVDMPKEPLLFATGTSIVGQGMGDTCQAANLSLCDPTVLFQPESSLTCMSSMPGLIDTAYFEPLIGSFISKSAQPDTPTENGNIHQVCQVLLTNTYSTRYSQDCLWVTCEVT